MDITVSMCKISAPWCDDFAPLQRSIGRSAASRRHTKHVQLSRSPVATVMLFQMTSYASAFVAGLLASIHLGFIEVSGAFEYNVLLVIGCTAVSLAFLSHLAGHTNELLSSSNDDAESSDETLSDDDSSNDESKRSDSATTFDHFLHDVTTLRETERRVVVSLYESVEPTVRKRCARHEIPTLRVWARQLCARLSIPCAFVAGGRGSERNASPTFTKSEKRMELVISKALAQLDTRSD